ncbi:MAG: DUF1353 domain-containing protein [Rhizobiales bacterium]|nr:DUF1353 domain-containing protein [Hyphomicrobiales bacterium]
MSAFTGPLSIREDRVDSELWALLEPLSFVTDGGVLTVPVPFVSDGASIPWPASIVFPHWAPRYRRPSVLHDYLRRLIDDDVPHPLVQTRRRADAIFLEAMTVCGVSWPVRTAFWLAVRVYTLIVYRD